MHICGWNGEKKDEIFFISELFLLKIRLASLLLSLFLFTPSPHLSPGVFDQQHEFNQGEKPAGSPWDLVLF